MELVYVGVHHPLLGGLRFLIQCYTVLKCSLLICLFLIVSLVILLCALLPEGSLTAGYFHTRK